jgi:hypothetical protein
MEKSLPLIQYSHNGLLLDYRGFVNPAHDAVSVGGKVFEQKTRA